MMRRAVDSVPRSIFFTARLAECPIGKTDHVPIGRTLDGWQKRACKSGQKLRGENRVLAGKPPTAS
jgi:hypothetical protein